MSNLRDEQWYRYLTQWDIPALQQLTLEQYCSLESKQTLSHWLLEETAALGDFKEGPLSMGIRPHGHGHAKPGNAYNSYDDQYVWLNMLGSSAEEAFASLKNGLLEAAEAGRTGELERLDALTRQPGALMRKVAFLYQDRENPSLLPIYSKEVLRAAAGEAASRYTSALNRDLMAQRGELSLWAFADELMQLAAQRWSGQRIKELLDASEYVSPVKPAAARMAGFQARDGRQLAVEPGPKPALFLEPGDWLADAELILKAIEPYTPERTRHSGLQANAPRLWMGRPAVYVTVPDEEAFQSLLSLYIGNDSADQPTQSETQTGTLPMTSAPLNQILFGPPGTGKTYATVEAALEVLDGTYLQTHRQDRTALKLRFDELVQQERIRFVTFHQSFSYEDFVEGLRAESDGDSGQLRYEVVDGVFKSLCEAAAAKVTQQAEAPVDLGKRKIWKMSLGNTQGSDAGIYEECVQGGYMLLGYGGGIDFTGCKNRGDVQRRFIDAGVNPDGPYDYSVTSVTAFVTKMKPGDLVVVSDGNFKFRAIGEVAGDYAFKIHPEYDPHYSQMRPVKWLRQYSPSLPHSELLNGQFSQMTLYELRSPTLNREKLQGLLGSQTIEDGALFHVGQRFGQGYAVRSISSEVVELDKPKGGVLPLPLSLVRQLLAYVQSGQLDVEDIRQGRIFQKVEEAELEKFIVNGYQSLFAAMVEQLLKPQAKTTTADARVLIIDEINRGNISRIFGELITLIEPSKRSGADEALSVVLPYSKQPFSVTKNVYLIGTMNTADRSLAGLDIALRRRFTFREMPPKPELLDKVQVQGVRISQLLRVMNQRIEVLLDRDHCLGHAYFMPLKDDNSLDRLESIFRNQILPLLQEYFFEDWERIQWVLNDHRKPSINQFVCRKVGNVELLFGQDVGQSLERDTWSLNEEAFERLESYMGIVDHQLQSVDVGEKRKASHGDLLLRELSTGSIEVWRADVLQQPTKPLLRDLAGKLGVETYSDSGSPLNTRALGRRLIDQLGSGNA